MAVADPVALTAAHPPTEALVRSRLVFGLRRTAFPPRITSC